MGVTNYDNLPERQVVTKLRRLGQSISELKGAAQPVGGDSLMYHRIDNAGEFAWSGRTDSPSPQAPGTGGAFFEVTIISPNVEVALTDVVMEVFTSTDGVTWTRYTRMDEFNAVPPQLWYFIRPKPGAANVPHQSHWLVELVATLNARVAFKLQALSTDAVSISVTRTS